MPIVAFSLAKRILVEVDSRHVEDVHAAIGNGGAPCCEDGHASEIQAKNHGVERVLIGDWTGA